MPSYPWYAWVTDVCNIGEFSGTAEYGLILMIYSFLELGTMTAHAYDMAVSTVSEDKTTANSISVAALLETENVCEIQFDETQFKQDLREEING